MPTAGQVRLEYNPLWWKGVFAQLPHSCPHVGAFVFFFKFSYFLVHRFPSFSMEEYLKIIICPNRHISDDRQIMGQSANIYFSFMLCQRNVLKWQTHPLLIPMAKCILFDKKSHIRMFMFWLQNMITKVKILRPKKMKIYEIFCWRNGA